MARVSDTLINTLFDGRYRILRRLGSGGMATVYLAEDEELGRRVAIKILSERYANDEAFIERFRREAKSAAGLSHPNVVSIYDRGEAEGTYYIAMEVIEGRSLKEIILTRGALPVDVAIAFAKQLLEALRYAHRHGIIHRDIKPHNVLVSSEERVKGHEPRLKVTDFGIARHGASQMTEAGSIMGTAQYLSPEQARGAPVTAASDLYSAGVVLYEMLTGKVPFTGDSAIEIAMKHVNELPKPPSQLRPEVTPELDKIVLRALAKEPEDRYQTAEGFIEDLERVEAGLPLTHETATAATAILAGAAAGTAATSVLPDGAGEAPAPPKRPPPRPPDYDYEERPKRRVLPWLLVALLLAGAAFAGWYVYGQVQEQLEANEPVGVPLVEGLREQEAINRIQAVELQPRVERAASRDVPRGVVFDQDPQEGTRIQKGDTVTITVSTGVPRVDVPRVVGDDFEQAIRRLDEAGLDWERVDVFSEAPVGQVVAQDPQAGASVAEGTTVTLRVSQGVETVAVPDVLLQTQQSASQELSDNGFDVAVVEAPSDEVEAGLVSAQDPAPNAQAQPGSTVQITVSTGPENVPVPNVLEMDEESAIQTLEGGGFSVDVQDEEVQDPNLDGVVLDQSPAPDEEVEPGSEVTIVVGRLPPEEQGEGQ
jgi:eukaryotic-like serine/threonine-protein kinase